MKVEMCHTALAVGSGDLEVFATPAMVALMEGAAMLEGAKLVDNHSTTVGTALNINHLRATPLGGDVWAEATLTLQDGRRLVFEVKAFDAKGEIGRGTHERYVVNRAKFLAKL